MTSKNEEQANTETAAQPPKPTKGGVVSSQEAVYVFPTLSAVLVADAADPRLRIEPAEPLSGGTLTVTFDPRGGPLEKSTSLTLIYGFIPMQSARVPLGPKKGRFTAEIRIPDDAAVPAREI